MTGLQEDGNITCPDSQYGGSKQEVVNTTGEQRKTHIVYIQFYTSWEQTSNGYTTHHTFGYGHWCYTNDSQK